jgi:hypothetical protein
MPNEALIKLAIGDLDSQKAPNIAAIARKYGIARKTLSDRFNRRTVSTGEVHSQSLQLLTNEQEEVLIEHIFKLSARGSHTKPQMLRNLARDVVKKPVSERWSRRFRKRHENRLSSVYMLNIDCVRQTRVNSAHFQHYFDTVRAL